MRKLFFPFLVSGIIGCGIVLSCQKEPFRGETNKPPIAIAGSDQIITLPTDSISLDGSASSDPDGKIIEWLWAKISGPASFNIVNASNARAIVINLVRGIYQFELTVKDDRGLQSRDTMSVVVDDRRTNQPPVANAGPDQSIVLPLNSISLNGGASTDPDNNITSYEWSQISGPSSFTIASANSVQTQVTGLVAGVYSFELKVTDAGGLFAKDTIEVMVISQPVACTDCKIAFVSDRDGDAEIYSCNADGSDIRRLTNQAGIDDQPAWSPDGKHIAFISDRTGNPQLYIMDADGSNVVQKTFSQGPNSNPTWSPDGTRIAYATLINGSMDIWVVGAMSGSPSSLFGAPGWDEQPAWSPQGNKIALASDWAAYDFVYDIYMINAGGTEFTALTGNISDGYDYTHPSWCPSGTKLAMAICINQEIWQVGIMNADGSGKTMIASGTAAWTRTSWSADGNKIAYTSLSGSRKDVSWVSLDGSTSGTIVTNGWNADWQH